MPDSANAATVQKPDMDPVTFEVLRNAVINATEEMALTVRRAAYSTNIKTRADFSCAFFDTKLRCIAQSFAPALPPRCHGDHRSQRHPRVRSHAPSPRRCNPGQ